MNHYCPLEKVKRNLLITDSSRDEQIFDYIEEASRIIDAYCGRHFYVRNGSTIVDVDHSSNNPYRLIFSDDVLSVDSITIDSDLDLQFDDGSLQATDFILFPRNSYPKLIMDVNNLLSSNINSDAHSFEITGKLGYGDGTTATPYIKNSHFLSDNASDSTDTIRIFKTTAASAGYTLHIGSEQMFVRKVEVDGTDNVLTVDRGVNGTTAASHVTGTEAKTYVYPGLISRCCLNIVSAFNNTTGKQGLMSESIAGYSYTMSGSFNVSNIGISPSSAQRMMADIDIYRKM